MAIWFTSDLHFGHANIIGYANRPFTDVDDMNDCLIEYWNDVVEYDDTVYVLGDVAMGHIADTLPLVGLLNGKKLLIPGNHDRCWTGHKKIGDWKERYEEVGFTVFPNEVRLPINAEEGGDEVLLCHFPYEGDSRHEDRYKENRPFDDGSILLHGHVHSEWKRNGRMINVGCDVWGYRPVSLDELLAA